MCVCVCSAGMCAERLGEDRVPVKLDGTSEQYVCVVQVCVQGDWERTEYQSNWMGPVSSVRVCVWCRYVCRETRRGQGTSQTGWDQ